MTFEETEVLLSTIKAAFYGYDYSDHTVHTWYKVLQHYEYGQVNQRLYDYIRLFSHHPGLNELVAGLAPRESILH
jgi:hypothetical protein